MDCQPLTGHVKTAPLQESLDVSFKVKHGGGYYTVYASLRSMKCIECGDVGHREHVEIAERHNEQMHDTERPEVT